MIIEDADPPALVWYPLVLLLLPLLVLGILLSYVLRRPRSAVARFALGFAIGSVLFVFGQTTEMRF